MSAKEMFEELGLKLQLDYPFGDCIAFGEMWNGQVVFDLSFKNITCNRTIDTELHKAIHQQMIELGWLDE